MEPNDIVVSYVLGLRIAEYVHGIHRTGDDGKTDEIYAALRAVANGDLTLIDTPEEVIASIPTPPEFVKMQVHPEFYERLRRGREEQKKIARILVQLLPQ